MATTNARIMDADDRGANKGWIAGFIVILVVLVIGAVLWFSFHP